MRTLSGPTFFLTRHLEAYIQHSTIRFKSGAVTQWGSLYLILPFISYAWHCSWNVDMTCQYRGLQAHLAGKPLKTDRRERTLQDTKTTQPQSPPAQAAASDLVVGRWKHDDDRLRLLHHCLRILWAGSSRTTLQVLAISQRIGRIQQSRFHSSARGLPPTRPYKAEPHHSS